MAEEKSALGEGAERRSKKSNPAAMILIDLGGYVRFDIFLNHKSYSS
jgi:hypothetical protein